jgi:hypothetical protein
MSRNSADTGDNGTALVARVVYTRDFIHRQRAFDVGVVQTDSLTMDKAATLENCGSFAPREDRLSQEKSTLSAKTESIWCWQIFRPSGSDQQNS